MRHLLPLTVAVLLLPFLGSLSAQPGKDDAQKIHGTWTVTAFKRDARYETPPEALKLKIGPDKMEPVGKNAPASYKLGVEKGVGTIDIVGSRGSEKGKAIKGIYELKGDDLKIC